MDIKKTILIAMLFIITGCVSLNESEKTSNCSIYNYGTPFVHLTRYNAEACIYHCRIPPTDAKPYGVTFKTNDVVNVYEFKDVDEFKMFLQKSNLITKSETGSGTFAFSDTSVSMAFLRLSDDWSTEWEICIGDLCKFVTTNKLIEQVIAFLDL